MPLNLPQNIAGVVGAAGMSTPPPVVPQDTNSVGVPQASPDEMIADLENKAAQVQGKNSALKAKEITSANNLDSIRTEVIQDLFATMKKNGVDPSDPEAIRAFLEKLAQEDPDLFEVFEMAFNNLVGPEEGQAPSPNGVSAETPPPGFPAPDGEIPPTGDQGLMGKFGNLSGEVMRQ